MSIRLYLHAMQIFQEHSLLCQALLKKNRIFEHFEEHANGDSTGLSVNCHMKMPILNHPEFEQFIAYEQTRLSYLVNCLTHI